MNFTSSTNAYPFTIHTGAEEVDEDGDESFSCEDCDDTDGFTFPGAGYSELDPSLCMTDADGDGYGAQTPSNSNAVPGTDCNDSSDLVNPGQAEQSGDGLDNNCDGVAE